MKTLNKVIAAGFTAMLVMTTAPAARANTGITIGKGAVASSYRGHGYTARPVRILRGLTATGRVAQAGEAAIAVEVEELDMSDVSDSEGEAGDGIGARGVFSIQLAYPQIIQASVGVIIGSDRTPEVMSGILIQLEGGLNGFGGSVGYAIKGDMKLGALSVNGFAVKVSGLYTYNVTQRPEGEPLLGIKPGATYVGPELDFVMGIIKLSVGVMYKVAEGEVGEDGEASDWLAKAGFGVQF